MRNESTMSGSSRQQGVLGASLKVWLAREPHEELEHVTCPKCQEEMALHLPDMRRPERVLATCDRCGGWYVVSLPDVEGTDTLLVHFPAAALLRRAAQTAGLDTPLS